jgi:hypothetical protein
MKWVLLETYRGSVSNAIWRAWLMAEQRFNDFPVSCSCSCCCWITLLPWQVVENSLLLKTEETNLLPHLLKLVAITISSNILQAPKVLIQFNPRKKDTSFTSFFSFLSWKNLLAILEVKFIGIDKREGADGKELVRIKSRFAR